MTRGQRLTCVIAGCLLLLCIFQRHAGAQAAQDGQGFTVSGGISPAAAHGTIGTSPEMNLAAVGIRAATTYHARFSYPVPLEFMRTRLRLTAEFHGASFSGEAVYSGNQPWTAGETPPFRGIWYGDHLESQLDLNWTLLSADVLFRTYEVGGLGRFYLGPRLQGFIYNDTFTIDNRGGSGVTQVRTYEQTRDYTMVGLGVAGSLGLEGLAPGGFRGLSPSLNFAGASCRCAGMKAYTSEVFLTLAFRPSATFVRGARGGFPLPGLSLEVGYAYTSVIETNEEITGFGGPDRRPRTDAARYQVGAPTLRVQLAF